MPPIFAYSCLVDESIIQNTKKSGFLECIDSPLNVNDINRIIVQYLDIFADTYIRD